MATTGHDLHFLERLERVSASHVELAISLYQDPELVRHILHQVRLPDGEPRVAIALGDDDPAPHAIVTRSGAFVTCLAAGMTLGTCPALSWQRVAAISGHFREQRARMREYRRLSKRMRSGELITRVVTAGDGLSREEFTALTAWAPIAQGVFLRQLVEAYGHVHKVGRLLAERHRARTRDRELLKVYWQAFWAIGHWTLLLGVDGRELLDRLVDTDTHAYVAGPAYALRHVALTLRGLWAVGRIGKPLVGPMRRALPKAETSMRIHELMLGLSVIAARNTGLRGEIERALAVRRFGDAPAHAPFAEFADGVATQTRHAFEHADENVADWRAYGRSRVHAEVQRLPEGHPLRFADANDVPDDLAFAAAAEHDGDPFGGGELSDDQPPLLTAVPWLPRARAEDFYFPERYLRAVGTRRFEVARALALHRRFQALFGPGETIWRASPRTRRNERCPCGSEKKFKRCHGA
jgi:hypothetical protein